MDFWGGFFLGLISGLLFMFVMIDGSQLDIYFQSVHDAIEQCEKSLPRDQECDYKVETFVKKAE